MSMKKKEISGLKFKSGGRDIRLRPYVATTLEQIGNVRESRGVRKMAASTCIVVLYPARST